MLSELQGILTQQMSMPYLGQCQRLLISHHLGEFLPSSTIEITMETSNFSLLTPEIIF